MCAKTIVCVRTTTDTRTASVWWTRDSRTILYRLLDRKIILTLERKPKTKPIDNNIILTRINRLFLSGIRPNSFAPRFFLFFPFRIHRHALPYYTGTFVGGTVPEVLFIHLFYFKTFLNSIYRKTHGRGVTTITITTYIIREPDRPYGLPF